MAGGEERDEQLLRREVGERGGNAVGGAGDGVVKDLEVEAPGEFRVSTAEYMLSKLPPR